jgi:hypothetical protein
VGLAFGGIILLGAPGRAQEPDRFVPLLPLLVPAQLAEPAQLEVKSLPCGASVYVDGLYRGNTPLHLELEPGTYDVRVEMDGYESFQRAVTLLAGHSLRLQSSFAPSLRRNPTEVIDPWAREHDRRHPRLRPFY